MKYFSLEKLKPAFKFLFNHPKVKTVYITDSNPFLRKKRSLELLNFLIESKRRIEKVLYVSCDPTHLARDLKVLKNGGFIIEEVIPFDMFPRTKHIEVL